MDQSTCSSRNTDTSKQPRRNPERGPRSFWTPQEEAELIEALKSLEKIMDEKFPGCGIQSKHIKSKLQVWKKDYGHILGILGSSGGAGASIDPNTHMIVADSESVWSDYVKVHPGAAKLRGKPFPLYHSWVEIFGNDRAQGTGAIDVGDALNDLMYGSQGRDNETYADNMFFPPCSTPLQSPETAYDDDVSATRSDDGVQNQRSSFSSKRKRKDTNLEDIGSMVGTFLQETSSAIRNLAERMRPLSSSGAQAQPTDSDLRKALYVAMTEIPGLSMEERVLATHRLVKNDKYMDAFWGMDADARGYYVRILLRRGSGQ
ncbi:hypothetical protein CDL12_08843 [Handroanthus impetiginosus]|uniref:Myb/SANT-like domain-containing protein n=1 Tax=Handroanthus impetiginosus TaxID=429701 RepID=A0A2G9HLT6_9LAMI|nr:hypothetical protein CDL12_08843 [Handroanthus impetiginosus]